MSDDYYYDAGAAAWRTKGDDAWLGERAEDDAPEDAPEWRDREELPAPPDEEAADEPSHDPMDDPEFRAAMRGQRELSGRVPLHGRRRGNHGTGRKGHGMRFRPIIRPTGRQLGAPAPAVGRPSFSDASELVARLLGPERVELLKASFTKRGANADERAARVYLAVLLRALSSTAANRAAVELLVEKPATDSGLRKIGDLRRREYNPGAVEAATQEIAARLRHSPKTT